MRWLLAAELLAALSGSVTFVALYSRRRWRSSAEGRQLMVTLAYWSALIVIRLVSDFAVAVPAWVFALVWAPFGVVIWRWVWLLRGPTAGPAPDRSGPAAGS